MKLNTKYDLTTNAPVGSHTAAMWFSIKPKELNDALDSGSGVGIPGDNSTPAQGSIEAGMLMMLSGTAGEGLILAEQRELGTDMPGFYVVVHSGNTDFTLTGDITTYHGGSVYETEYYDAGSYPPGYPVVPSGSHAGYLMPKGSASDNIQHIGFVGPNGVLPNGALEVIMPQSV